MVVAVAAADVQGVADRCCFDLCQAGNEQTVASGALGDHDDGGGDGTGDPREYLRRARHHSTRAHSPCLHSPPSRDRGYGSQGRRHVPHYQEFGGRRCWGYRARHSIAGTLQRGFRRACQWTPGRSRGESSYAGDEVWSSSFHRPSYRSVRSVGYEDSRHFLYDGVLLVPPFEGDSRWWD